MGLSFSLKGLQQSITLASIVFTLSFCLNLVAGKNLPYKGSPSAGTKRDLEKVEDTEDNNGERGNYKLVEGDDSQNYLVEEDDTEDNNGRSSCGFMCSVICSPGKFWHRRMKKCVTA